MLAASSQQALPRSNLMKRFGDVRDIADAVCYLAGPSGAFMTGEVVTVGLLVTVLGVIFFAVSFGGGGIEMFLLRRKGSI